MTGAAKMFGPCLMLLLGACGGDGMASDASATANAGAAVEPVAVTPATPVSPSPQSSAAPAAQANDSLEAFWTKFRSAALANDADAIAKLSAPVVMQHGDLDDSPKVRLSPAQVPAVLSKLLNNPDGVDPQGRTQREMLRATTVPKLDTEWSTERLRFGDMEFARSAQGWRLETIYYESYEE